MKLIKPYFEIIEPTGYTVDDIYKSIELAGRVSHKSEDKITEDSAKAFVGRMLNMKHLATCEFGAVYLRIPEENLNTYREPVCNYYNHYSKVAYANHEYFISTNYRILVENNWLDDLQYLCRPTEYHHKRYTVKFICDRGVTHEFVRHRPFSFMQESTRYCNYSKGKFNNELTFIIPCWSNIEEQDYGDIFNVKEPNNKLSTNEYAFIDALRTSEAHYIGMVSNDWKPEQARAVLPNALKTELYMCGYAEDWEHFFKLRDDKQHAHPQAYELAHPLHEEFIKRGYL